MVILLQFISIYPCENIIPFVCMKIGIRACNKKPDVDIGDKARSIKTKFENGEVFKDEQNYIHQVDDSAVFEHGIF